jgi:hypothetical protein
VLRVEDVRCGRVVDDDRLTQRAADLAQILDVVALVVVARLAEQTVVDRVGDVELVEKGIAVFGYGCGEDDNFVDLSDAFEEGVDAGALDYVDVVVLSFDFDRDCEIGLVEDLTKFMLARIYKRGSATRLTLKLLWTSVSSRSRTKHFFPLN